MATATGGGSRDCDGRSWLVAVARKEGGDSGDGCSSSFLCQDYA